MAWFLNVYKCGRCKRRWTDEWSCTCDDDCPHCGARHMSPSHSEDLPSSSSETETNSSLSVHLIRPSTTPTIARLAAFRRASRPKSFSHHIKSTNGRM
jgi:DNA-directed RNA polymerase subunit RPC12/RpoP